MTVTHAPLFLAADVAADLMVAGPVSLRKDASLREALELFTQRGIGAAPVIDDAGHPIGVLSRGDILIHERETIEAPKSRLEPRDAGEDCDQTLVRDLMTPAIFSVRLDTPAATIVSELVSLRVQRLFVVDDDGVLVGVISALDILERLRP